MERVICRNQVGKMIHLPKKKALKCFIKNTRIFIGVYSEFLGMASYRIRAVFFAINENYLYQCTNIILPHTGKKRGTILT